MSEKKYPTRMHEILGVEPNERFKVQNWHEKNEAYVDEKGVVISVLSGEFPRQLDAHDVCLLVNHPERVIRKPRLTEAQIKYLKAALTLEFEWLAKDAGGSTYFYERKPTQFASSWGCRGQSIEVFVEEVRALVSWNDPEPLDIAATLKAAGVEV
jgi:hypothetical protein